jgi:hypothetical protein
MGPESIRNIGAKDLFNRSTCGNPITILITIFNYNSMLLCL